MVVCTDEPCLEIFDPLLEQWIAIEVLIHNMVKSRAHAKDNTENAHRRYAVAFFSDSVVHIDPKKKRLQPVLHRVSGAEEERISVVFKQRTTPFVSMRYQVSCFCFLALSFLN